MNGRVLHAISEMGTGGAERLVVELVDRGAAAGRVSGVVSGGGRWADELGNRGVATYRMPVVGRSPVRLLRAVMDLRRAIRRFGPETVLAHNVVATLVAWIALRTLRTPVRLVTVFHGVQPADYPRAARVLGRCPEEIVAVSEAVARRLRAAGVGEVPLRVIRNAVTPRPVGDRAEARRALGLPPDRPVVLCLARLAPQKRHDVLLRTWALLGPDPILLLAGDGPLRAALEAEVGKLRLSDQVRFLGAREDVDRLLAAADVTVLASDWEGLPLAVLESLAAERPVVATDVDGVRDILAGGAGVLVAPDDPAAMAAALRTLLADVPEQAKIAAAGVKALRRDHDPDAMMRAYDDLLDTVDTQAAAVAPAAERAPHRASPHRRWLVIGAISALAGLAVTGLVVLATALQSPSYEGRIGLLALPAVAAAGSTEVAEPVVSASYGEVVALALPSLTELATTPSVLRATALSVRDAPPSDELAEAISVELLPGSGVARLSVRAATPELAARLAEVLAAAVIRADVLAPAATLQTLDDQATVIQVSPDMRLGVGLALLAGLVAAAAAVALLRPFRPRLTVSEAVLEAVADAGRGPVAVLDGADPVLVTRIIVLQRAANRPVRVLGAGPGLGRHVRSLEAELAQNAAFLGMNGDGDRSGVVAVVDRRTTKAEDVTVAVASLPTQAPLLAVVLV